MGAKVKNIYFFVCKKTALTRRERKTKNENEFRKRKKIIGNVF